FVSDENAPAPRGAGASSRSGSVEPAALSVLLALLAASPTVARPAHRPTAAFGHLRGVVGGDGVPGAVVVPAAGGPARCEERGQGGVVGGLGLAGLPGDHPLAHGDQAIVDVARVGVVGVGATVLVAPDPLAAGVGPVGPDVGPAFGAGAGEEGERGCGVGRDVHGHSTVSWGTYGGPGFGPGPPNQPSESATGVGGWPGPRPRSWTTPRRAGRRPSRPGRGARPGAARRRRSGARRRAARRSRRSRPACRPPGRPAGPPAPRGRRSARRPPRGRGGRTPRRSWRSRRRRRASRRGRRGRRS